MLQNMKLSDNKIIKEFQWFGVSITIVLLIILTLWLSYGNPVEFNQHDTYYIIPLEALFLLSFVLLSFLINLIRLIKVRLSSIPFIMVFLLQLIVFVSGFLLIINQETF